MSQTVIGALAVTLGLDTSAFMRGATQAQRETARLGRDLTRIGNSVAGVGRSLTMGLTVPLLAVGAASVTAFAQFERSMSNVSTLIDTTTESMAEMSEAVIAISQRTPVALNELSTALYDIRSAGTSAGQAMDVLEGSARLAVAGLGSTQEAADLVTSSINAFRLSGADAARVYDVIFKTVQSGKTTISQLAQGFGAVAGTVAQAGVQFDEYLASVAALTTTGLPAAQAHTQIRAAIVGLTRDTRETAAVFRHLRVDNFQQLVRESGGMVAAFQRIGDAVGWNDAAMIQLLGSSEAYAAVIGTARGQNAAFTATLENMRNGANAVNDAFDRQNSTASAALQRMRNELTAAAIAIGAELLPAVTSLVRALQTVASWFTSLPGPVRSTIVQLLAFAAAVGPLIWALGRLIAIYGTLLTLGVRLAAGWAALVGVQGALTASSTALAAALARLRVAMAFLLHPYALVIMATVGALVYFGQAARRAGEASEDARRQAEQLAAAKARLEDLTSRLATQTGREREETMAAARAAVEKARADVRAAMAAIQRARAEYELARAIAAQTRHRALAYSAREGGGPQERARIEAIDRRAADAEADLAQRRENLRESVGVLVGLLATINNPAPVGPPSTPEAAVTFGDGSGRDRPRRQKDEAEQRARRRHEVDAELRRARIDELRASQALTHSAAERAAIAEQVLELEREQAARDRELAVTVEDRTRAEADALAIAQNRVFDLERQHIREEEERRLLEERLLVEDARREIQVELAAMDERLADTAGEQRAAALRLLDLQFAQERARLEALAADRTISEAAREEARLRLEALGQLRAGAEAQVRRSTMGPLEDFLDRLPTTAARANEALESVAANGLRSVTDGLTDAIMMTRSWGDVFKNVARQIIADLIRIQIQRHIVEPMANALSGLFGGSGGGGGLGGLLSSAAAAFGGPRARGGPVVPGKYYLVGEKGPEIFAPSTAGAIVPNGGAVRVGAGAGLVRVAIDLKDDMLTARIAETSAGVVAHLSPGIEQRAEARTIATLSRPEIA